MGEPELSVVVPVYCSAETLRPLVRRLSDVLSSLTESWELIFVDDGSRDRSWEVLETLQSEQPDRLFAIQLMRNFGQHNALMCGFRQARGRLIITLDDDGQNPPEEIPILIRALDEQQADLVYGVAERRQHANWRNAGSAVVNLFFRRVFRLPVTVSSFRVMRRELVQAILSYSLNFTYIDGLCAWNSQRIAEVTVAHHPRQAGRSGYSLSKLTMLALNLFTNFSLLPLQLVSLLGLCTAGFGFLIGCSYLVLWLSGQISVPGYASLITAILMLGGVQLLSLGIMGEYLGRLHLNMNRKPQYTIRRAAGQPVNESQDRMVRTAETTSATSVAE